MGGGNAITQAEPVLNRHAGALRQRLQRRMRGVPQQDDTLLVPMPDRIAVADGLAPAKVEHRQQRLHRRMRAAVGVLELGTVSRYIAPL
jgi:hypothetical protein